MFANQFIHLQTGHLSPKSSKMVKNVTNTYKTIWSMTHMRPLGSHMRSQEERICALRDTYALSHMRLLGSHLRSPEERICTPGDTYSPSRVAHAFPEEAYMRPRGHIFFIDRTAKLLIFVFTRTELHPCRLGKPYQSCPVHLPCPGPP